MEIKITGSSKEIADFVAEIQSRLIESCTTTSVIEELAEKTAEAVTKDDVRLFG